MPELPRSRILRFLVVGGINTVATYLLLFGLLFVVSSAFAYAIAFAAGVLLNTLAVGPYVFGVRPTVMRQAAYVVWLLVTFAAGLAAVTVATHAHLPRGVVAALPPLVTAPLGFLGGRLLLASTNESNRQEAR